MFENVPTVSAAERQQVLAALERLQSKLAHREDRGHGEVLGALRDTLQSPLLGHILTLQHSIKQLGDQLGSMPPDACSDFGFSRKGQLIVSAGRPASSLATSGPASSPANGSAPGTAGRPSPDQVQIWLRTAAKGRQTETIGLSKPPSGGLGFSVVGLKQEGTAEHGVFIKQIQPGSVAHRDGRLREKDQILVINGAPLEQGVSHQQALSLLQQPGDKVELVVARDRPPPPPTPTTPPPNHTDQWGHVEEIELVNDGSGLGFGIVGGRSTGVVVRTLVPNSVADKDGRLWTGDHILRIGDTPIRGLASDQVVKVLQGCGSHVRMLIARDPLGQGSGAPPPPPPPASAPVSAPPPRAQPHDDIPKRRLSKTPNLEGYEIHEVALTKKEDQSLGISIIGYNSLTSQDAVGVFVKHVVPGSPADLSGNIRVHDRLIALDGVNLHGFTNQEVLEVMKQTGQTVHLTLVRKMVQPRSVERSLDKVSREPSRVSLKRSVDVKLRSSDLQRPPVSASGPPVGPLAPAVDVTQQSASSRAQLASEPELPALELRRKWEQALGPKYKVLVVELDPVIEDDAELQKYSKLLPIHTMRLGVELDSFDGHHYISSVAPGGPVAKHGLIRPEDELLEVNEVQLYGKSRREAVAFLREVPPPFTLVCCRHPVHLGGDYQPDLDQEQDLDLDLDTEPQVWRDPSPTASTSSSTAIDQIEMKLSSLLVGSSVLPDSDSKEQQQEQEVLHKPAEVEPHIEAQPNEEEEESEEEEEEDEEEEGELALWSPEVQVLELEKERDQSLGFSILDYQDPLDPSRCVMVIRSLVPGGAAELQGGLLPGDQLVSVNHMPLDSLSLAQAVEVLKAAPPGTVRLGIRKPLVVDGGEEQERGDSEQVPSGQRDDDESEGMSVSLINAPLPVPKGFGDGSILPEDLREEAAQPEEEEEPELILDGGLPRYATLTPTLLDLTLPPAPGLTPSPLVLPGEGKEMAVDEEVEVEKESEQRVDALVVEQEKSEGERAESLPRKEPPSWEEWERSHPVVLPAGPSLVPQTEESLLTNTTEEERGVEIREEEEEELSRPQEEDTISVGSLGQLVRSWAHSRDSEADSELTLTDTDTESMRVIDTERRKRRSQGGAAPPIRGGHSSDLPEREEGEGEETPAFSHWGLPRKVEVRQEAGQSLGISIVGGRHVIKRLRNGEELKGIFIKQVLPDSPADRTGSLKTGDKILEVSGVDLRCASHEEAVQAIKSAPSPVVFIVQSLSAVPRKSSIAPPPVRLPPPYRPPGTLEQEPDPELEQARGRVA